MELEEVKNKLNKTQYNYFLQLKEQINLPLYFFGSITRGDYIKDKSDLDVEIFTDNFDSILLQIENLLDYKKKRYYIIFEINNIPFSGYKYYFEDTKLNICFDFTIYNTACKTIILQHRNIEKNIPYLLVVFLIIIKTLYYHLDIINKNTYSYIKKHYWILYNPEKSVAYTLNKDKYIKYYNNQSNKKFLIKI